MSLAPSTHQDSSVTWAVWISFNISMKLLILHAVWNRPYGDLLYKNIISAACAFILASCVVLFLGAKQLLFFQPLPLLPRLPLFPTLSKNVCHHLSVFPHCPLHQPHQVHCSYNPTSGNRFGPRWTCRGAICDSCSHSQMTASSASA